MGLERFGGVLDWKVFVGSFVDYSFVVCFMVICVFIGVLVVLGVFVFV